MPLLILVLLNLSYRFVVAVDGSKPPFQPWAGNDPNNAYGNEDCVETRLAFGDWIDVYCGGQLPFVCVSP